MCQAVVARHTERHNYYGGLYFAYLWYILPMIFREIYL